MHPKEVATPEEIPQTEVLHTTGIYRQVVCPTMGVTRDAHVGAAKERAEMDQKHSGKWRLNQ